MADLSWVGPISTGRSHMTYFGSTGTEREVVIVTPVSNPKDGLPAWQIAFNDASCRTPAAPCHSTLEAAFAQAAIELSQPIGERGQRSRRLNAFLITKARFPGHEKLSDKDLFAACTLIAATLHGVAGGVIYSQFGRDCAAAA